MCDVGAQPVDDQSSASLRGFGPIGLVAIAAVLLTGNVSIGPMIPVPVGALVVLLWVQLSRTPWRDIGFSAPRNWMITVVGGLAFGCAFKVLMKAVVMPRLGADPVNHAFHFLAGNRAMLPGAVLTMQGLAGVEQALATGAVFGTIFATTGRIWGVMLAHAAFDLTALAIIYFDLESTVAHLVFK